MANGRTVAAVLQKPSALHFITPVFLGTSAAPYWLHRTEYGTT